MGFTWPVGLFASPISLSQQGIFIREEGRFSPRARNGGRRDTMIQPMRMAAGVGHYPNQRAQFTKRSVDGPASTPSNTIRTRTNSTR